MGYNKTFGCTYPTSKEEAAHMQFRKQQNIEQSKKNKSEEWMFSILKTKTSLTWSRQSIWAARVLDFWNHAKGIGVEVDGVFHNKEYDKRHDKYFYYKSGILILRLKPYDELSADVIINKINSSCTWNERRSRLGLKLLSNN